jgi:hypothetical protein
MEGRTKYQGVSALTKRSLAALLAAVKLAALPAKIHWQMVEGDRWLGWFIS